MSVGSEIKIGFWSQNFSHDNRRPV
jgi:hypothetical protein